MIQFSKYVTKSSVFLLSNLVSYKLKHFHSDNGINHYQSALNRMTDKIKNFCPIETFVRSRWTLLKMLISLKCYNHDLLWPERASKYSSTHLSPVHTSNCRAPVAHLAEALQSLSLQLRAFNQCRWALGCGWSLRKTKNDEEIWKMAADGATARWSSWASK